MTKDEKEYMELRSRVANMNKREIRARFKDLYCSRSYLRELKRDADADAAIYGIADEVIASLIRGAMRRLHMHDDPGSADQMLFAAVVIDVHGPKGLLF